MLNVSQIAHICHDAVRVYCSYANQPPILPWHAAPEWQRASAIDGVMNIMADPYVTPEGSHENWMDHKLKDGWVYGPEKDADKKTHPCLVPYHELPADQRVKDVLFVNIVRALMSPPIRRRPTVEELKEILQQPNRSNVSIQPDGSVTHEPILGAPSETTKAENMALLGGGQNTGQQLPDTYQQTGNASLPNKEANDGEEHTADKPGDPAAQADRDGAQAAGQEGNGTAEEGRLAGGAT